MNEQQQPALPEMSEGVKLLYKGAADNIIFLKRQQWVITNYALVVYAAVVALSNGANIHEKWALSIMAFCAWAYGSWCMVHTQKTMTKLRSTMFEIYAEFFTEEQRDKYRLWAKKPTFNYTPEFIWGLIIAHLVALALSIYLIWRGLPSMTKTAAPNASAILNLV